MSAHLIWQPPTGAGQTLPHPPRGAATVACATACACGCHDLRGTEPDHGRNTITSQANCADCGASRGRLVLRRGEVRSAVNRRARVYRVGSL